MNDWRQKANHTITTRAETIAERIMALHFDRQPDLVPLYGARKRACYIRDTRHHLAALAGSFVTSDPSLFVAHIANVTAVLLSHNTGIEGLPMRLICMQEVLKGMLSDEAWPYLAECIESALKVLA